MATRTAPSIIWIAKADDGDYEWLGYGRTKDEAVEALQRAWIAHNEDDGEKPPKPYAYRVRLGEGFFRDMTL